MTYLLSYFITFNSTHKMIYSILLGIAIFWLTSKIMDVKGWGLIMNTLFVIAGSVVGDYVLNSILHLNVGGGFISSVISGAVGCCLVLAAIKIIK